MCVPINNLLCTIILYKSKAVYSSKSCIYICKNNLYFGHNAEYTISYTIDTCYIMQCLYMNTKLLHNYYYIYIYTHTTIIFKKKNYIKI